MDLSAILAHGTVLHGQQRWPEALAHWQQAIARFPNEPMLHAQFGIASFSAGSLDGAERCFALLRSRFPQHPWGWFGRGLLAQVRHHWTLAAGDFAQVIAHHPDVAAAHEHHAQCMVKLGRIGEARLSAQAALRLEPGNANARALLAYANGVRKSTIINQLVERFGLRSYLEYNKYTGQLAIGEVRCADKTIVYFPEPGYDDAQAQQRVDAAAATYAGGSFLALDDLLAAQGGRRFDLIFLDPIHSRPLVDRCLQQLPALLAPGGFLLVHDCNPEDEALTTVARREGQWLGETYKAFALFHRHNRARSLTIDEDFGVGVICNEDLHCSYDTDEDIAYARVAANRALHLGLIGHDAFSARLANGVTRSALVEARYVPSGAGSGDWTRSPLPAS
jgi:tetratricopeptide (TPR) repeat protein